ncbi:THUMP domain-containing class I SAM-dependent RNA methyltransferase [Tropicibacter naphthalenivorans]|uniref:Ribosomal RNA large subunit methyltransferase L n=1 Tax=Tropicibacter naphthalenivorans TaxID=441103 RepID=A0A0P1G0L6_9RHOB|nr:RNA methyltransferase [Tropicibacter naphthalenivorans]CUH75256.1 Ribosomal RNA large subunit methyltransferase L [Tropicibacter naphthalenivorans]SMC45369.1 putative N6-adenine-specific DNA methylase [Tropicibacter naphthalenivorans]
MDQDFEIFASAPPGLEQVLLDEVAEQGFAGAVAVPGGVTFSGGWPEVARANVALRGAGRVLARIGSFRAFHLAQLDKRCRKFPWAEVFRPDVPLRVDVTCKNSKIYHDRAAKQRVEGALREVLGAEVSAEAEMRVMVRIEDDLVTISVDTSGEPLHRRGHKEAVGKAPMRETLAAMFLRQCGYTGSETVVDPMCGSGTFVIEAAEIAAGLLPGRSRKFAFDDLAVEVPRPDMPEARAVAQRFYGSDRDDGAIRSSTANAERAGVGALCQFTRAPVSDLQRPEGAPGLVMVNPPYGARIGNRKLLFALYGSLGHVLQERFQGWRLGMVTSDGGLAKATGLKLQAGPPVAFGGLAVKLYQARIG